MLDFFIETFPLFTIFIASRQLQLQAIAKQMLPRLPNIRLVLQHSFEFFWFLARCCSTLHEICVGLESFRALETDNDYFKTFFGPVIISNTLFWKVIISNTFFLANDYFKYPFLDSDYISKTFSNFNFWPFHLQRRFYKVNCSIWNGL